MTAADLMKSLSMLPEWCLFLFAGLSCLGSAWTCWHTASLGAKVSVKTGKWLFAGRPLTELGRKILVALDTPFPRTPEQDSLLAGGVRVQCKGSNWEKPLGLHRILLHGKSEDVKDLLPQREQKKVYTKAMRIARLLREEMAVFRRASALEALDEESPKLV